MNLGNVTIITEVTYIFGYAQQMFTGSLQLGVSVAQ